METPWLILIFALLRSFIECSSIEISVDTDKIKDIVSPKFLSMTIDPLTLALSSPLSSQTLQMAKRLSPSYVRICGHATNFLHFGKQHFKDNTTVTEKQIDSIVQFAKDANLDLIIGLNAMARENGLWHYENSHKLISYMAGKGYEASWQLGYDTNSIKMEQLSHDLSRLKKIVRMYPIYRNSLILGPDFDEAETENLENFVEKSGSTVSRIAMSYRKNKEKTLEESLIDFKRTVSKSGGTESVILALKDESRGTAEEAIYLAKTLGSAANLGYSMVLRKPGKIALSFPSSEFWFSYLYKMLVGNEVFETKLSPSDSKVKIYSHNTPIEPKETLFLNRGKAYKNGALTMFGVNESPNRIELKVGLEDEDVHLYVLTFDLNERTTYLNGKKLTMQQGFVPVISPEIISSSKIEMPPNSIFFIVRPNANVIKSQMAFGKVPVTRLSKISTRAIKPLNVSEILESYKKLTENIQSKILPKMDENEYSKLSYSTYMDDGWLNKLSKVVSKGEYITEDNENVKERKRRSLEEKDKTDKDEIVGAFFKEEEDQKEIDQTLLGIVKEGTNSTKESEEESQEEPPENDPVAKDASSDNSPVPEESQMVENQKEPIQEMPVESAPQEMPVESAPQEPPVVPVNPIPADCSPVNIFPVPGPSFIPIPMDPRTVEEETEKEFEELKNEKDQEVDGGHVQKIEPNPFINEKKEEMINSIIAKMALTEDAKYANKPVDLTRLEYEDNTAPLVEVVDPETKEQVFVPMQKLDSGESISLPDYGPTTTKVQREINPDYLKEKILETKKKFGTLGKPNFHAPVQESELRKANENLKGFLEQSRYDFESIRSKLNEARHRLFDSGEFAPLKNPDIKSLLRSWEESLEKHKIRLPKLPLHHRLRRSIAKRSIVDDLAQEVDKLKEKFSTFVDDVFGKIKRITKRSVPDSPPSDEQKNQSIDTFIDSIFGDEFFKQINELQELAKVAEMLKKKTEKNGEIPPCKCKESAALENFSNPRLKTKNEIASGDPAIKNLQNLLIKGFSQISQIFSASDKEKEKH